MASETFLEVEGEPFRISSPDKVLFPDQGWTKLDLANHFLLTGEVIRNERLFENFRYRFDVPETADEVAIPLVFRRYLRPGDIEVRIKIEDLHGRGELPLLQPPRQCRQAIEPATVDGADPLRPMPRAAVPALLPRLRPWRSQKLTDRCPSCRCSVAGDYWDFCAWCGRNLQALQRNGRRHQSG